VKSQNAYVVTINAIRFVKVLDRAQVHVREIVLIFILYRVVLIVTVKRLVRVVLVALMMIAVVD